MVRRAAIFTLFPYTTLFRSDLSRRMGQWAPRTRLVEVFFNQNGGNLDAGDYAGVYLLVDKIEVDAKRIDITELDTDEDRKSTRLNSSHSQISYAVFCLKKKK